MSVHILTKNPQGLLNEIRRLIDAHKIDTWQYDKDGDFSHTATQWKGKGWLRPKIGSDRLRMTFLKPQSAGQAREVYAVYSGRFIEMLIAHVPQWFTEADATPNPESDEAGIT